MKDVSIHPGSVTNFLEKLESAFHEGDADAHAKRTEADNVRRLQDQYRAIIDGDLAAVLDGMADDIELEMIGHPEAPLTGRWQGKNAVADAMRMNYGLLADQHAELLGLVAQGDTVVLFCKEEGRFRQTGKPYVTHWVQIYTYRDGKVARLRGLFDTAPILEGARPGAANP